MRQEKKSCPETMQAMFDPTHTHTCTGQHQDGDHFCAECKRWWWQAKKKEAS